MFHMLPKVGLVMWPLFFASILGVAVVIERILFVMAQKRAEDPELRKKILFYVGSGNFDRARIVGENSKDSIVKVLTEGLRQKESLEMALSSAAQKELKRYSHRIYILDTIITLAPLLGLLGTVTGMISAFGLIGGKELEAPSVITGGIAQALIATAYGLVIAVFCLIPHNWLNAYVEDMRDQMELAGTELELLIAKFGKSETVKSEQPVKKRELYEAPASFR